MYKDRWRIIISAPANGAWNMALDEAVLESTSARRSLPTLRLYAWEPACLSLGQAQPLSDVDLPALAALQWDLVRRPTGGRAILHTDELTYSISAYQDEPRVTGSILDSYRRLSQGLLAALASLGLPARADGHYPLPTGTQPNAAVCFEVPSHYEITVHGKKLIGSAQARRHGGVLQHGSLPLNGDLTRITRALAFPDQAAREEAAGRLANHATTVEGILGSSPTWQQAANAFRAAFEHVFNLEFVEAEPEKFEISRAAQLIETKYASPDWTMRL